MTIRRIVTLLDTDLQAKTQTDFVLRRKAEPVVQFDEQLDLLIRDMFETMYAAKGIGLAAPQIGVSLQLAVIDISENRSDPRVLINPVIQEKAGEALLEEGCLSIPGARNRVPRAIKLSLQALNQQRQFYKIEAEGLLAHCIQHELDHLAGKLFIDYLSPLKQQFIYKKLRKYSTWPKE
jgi:peptide deformylase